MRGASPPTAPLIPIDAFPGPLTSLHRDGGCSTIWLERHTSPRMHMPTSIRLDPELEARLRAIAESEGVPLSEVLRRAANRYLKETGSPLRVRLADSIGTIRSHGGRARRTGESYKRLIRRGA